MKSNVILPTYYQQFIHKSRYARWLDDENRREEWHETVGRYVDFMSSHLLKKHDYIIPDNIKDELHEAILHSEVMPSMRAMMTAGKALDRDNTAGYNCSYLPVDDPKAFDEAMYILMCGTGVGFSVERDCISKLPEIPGLLFDTEETIIVKDSKEGWAKAFRKLLALLWAGEIPKWDLSLVRPAGAKLKIFGGRASGPAPLDNLFRFTVKVFKEAKGRKLSSLECHDLMCKVGEVVVSGGVRRSAMISLSNLSDDRMRHAKTGEFYKTEPQRQMSNNSVAYTEKPDPYTFMREWLSLAESGTGERGMFYRGAAKNKAAENGRRNSEYDFGTNPCSEIILRPYQFCNLSEIIVRGTDTIKDLERKVRIATIIGTFQSTLTHFPYLRKIWHNNTAEERLLGVSMTGIMDNAITNGKDSNDLESVLMILKKIAVDTNKEFAEAIGIPQSTAITCVKPSGTVSQLTDSASGIHARHSQYYIRTVRCDKKDPLTQFMMDQNIPWETDGWSQSNVVFSFPIKAPDMCVTRDDMSAIEQLEFWKIYAMHWCEHKPSVTISVGKDEWLETGSWIYKNFDIASGLSFLPRSDMVYEQAPYQDCTEEHYKEFLAKMPEFIDWSKLADYEQEDNTVGNQTLACTSDSCEVVDIVN
jgi:ribonucleoside-diphosphate reductase alpha chain